MWAKRERDCICLIEPNCPRGMKKWGEGGGGCGGREEGKEEKDRAKLILALTSTLVVVDLNCMGTLADLSVQEIYAMYLRKKICGLKVYMFVICISIDKLDNSYVLA